MDLPEGKKRITEKEGMCEEMKKEGTTFPWEFDFDGSDSYAGWSC